MLKSSATSSEPHRARKRFGQNFLHDAHFISKIIGLIKPLPGDRIVEIGPGQAALTGPLIAAAGHIHAIEIDRDLAARLHEQFPAPSLSIDTMDVLKVDFRALAQRLGGPLRIVGNLPYNISSPILFHLLESADVIVDQFVMLQKEVVDRMVAGHGSKTFGRLSVMLQARYRMERCLLVPSGAFRPAPKVESAIARMRPLPLAEVQVADWPIFAAVVAMGFSQRRKMLRNTLAPYLEQIDWAQLGLLPTARAEEVSVETWVKLANQVAALPVVALIGGQRVETNFLKN
jgi:16S rRNA (adenine1518-N6/adenine1519-N6)-dimethyltransferase